MPYEKLADRLIREAMSEGKFGALPSKGAIDLEEYFKLPAELRMAYSILKSAGCIPEEVELLREVDRLQAALAVLPPGESSSELQRELAAAKLKLDLAMERTRRHRAANAAAAAE
jgi:hypothetical protein